MPFKIWAGIALNYEEFDAMKQFWMPRVRDTLHDALCDAMRINGARHSVDGRQQVVWAIECEDGSRLNRDDVARLIWQNRGELSANPPTTY